MEDRIPPAVTPESFRRVIGHFPSGVAIVTARHEGADFGATVSAVSSVSLDPPQLLVCLNRSNRSCAAVSGSGRFVVNVLGEDHAALARGFAVPGGDRFGGLALRRGATGAAILADALACIECDVAQEMASGTHVIFIGAVVAASTAGGAPLSYFRGGFGRFSALPPPMTP